jgi:putative restriction endonuclease
MDRFSLGHRAWPILVAQAQKRVPMFYKDLGHALGYRNARVTRAALSPIQDFCLEKGLPPLTSIVVNKATGLPGAGFKLTDGTIEDAQQRAFRKDWGTIPVPFGEPTLSRIRSTRRRGTKPQSAVFDVPDAEVLVNGRGPYQDRFRKTLLRIYGRCCALCDTRATSMLVASHIVPWAQDSRHRLNPQNGLLLCRQHDAAFECGLVRVDTDGSVNVSQEGARKLGRDLHAFLARTRRNLPPLAKLSAPRPEFLEWRFRRGKA